MVKGATESCNQVLLVLGLCILITRHPVPVFASSLQSQELTYGKIEKPWNESSIIILFIYLFCLLNKLTLKGVITYNVKDVQNRNRPQATHTALSPRFPNGYHYPVFLLRVCRATNLQWRQKSSVKFVSCLTFNYLVPILVPRPVCAIGVGGGGLEPSAREFSRQA